MNISQSLAKDRAAAIAIVESDIPDQGWMSCDLNRIMADLGPSPKLNGAESDALATGARHVPDSDIILIAARAEEPTVGVRPQPPKGKPAGPLAPPAARSVAQSSAAWRAVLL